MWALTALATATITTCIGSNSVSGRMRFNMKTVEIPIVNHKTAKAVILVLKDSPLPSL